MFAELALAAVLVQPGDTMSGIAAAHAVSLAAVEADNPQIGNPNEIFPGETVYIPSGDSSTAPAPAETPSQNSSAPATPSGTSSAAPGSFQQCVIQRENSGSYAWGTGDGGGAYQFEPSTWAAFAPPGAAYGSASPAQQDQAFRNAMAAGDSSAWSQYDGCQV